MTMRRSKILLHSQVTPLVIAMAVVRAAISSVRSKINSRLVLAYPSRGVAPRICCPTESTCIIVRPVSIADRLNWKILLLEKSIVRWPS
jgi:hypothetical protein